MGEEERRWVHDAHALLDEAADLAESSAAHAVMASVREARAACT